MTHHDADRNRITAALELLTENGFAGMASAIELLLNEAMKVERSAFLAFLHQSLEPLCSLRPQQIRTP